VPPKLAIKFGNSEARIAEDEHCCVLTLQILFDELDQDVQALGILHPKRLLRRTFSGLQAALHLHDDRVLQEFRSQPANLWWNGGRKQHGLSYFGQIGCDSLDIVNEAHIEHAIKFIKDETLSPLKMQESLLEKVQDSAWSPNDDLPARNASTLKTDLLPAN
jgi:hypothetical protein